MTDDRARRPRRHRPGDRHRRVRRRPQHGGPGAGERRLLRRRQPAAGADARHGRAGATRPAARPGTPRWCSTCAAGPSRPTSPARSGRCGSAASHPRVVFVDADDEVLIRRFESVRRSHPLQGDGRLADGIAAERELLARGARAGRRDHRHQPPQRQPAARRGWRSCSAARTPAGCGSPCCPSASSTACRPTPTSCSTRGSCPTRTGCRSCATTPGGTEAVSAYVLGQRGAGDVRRDVRPPDQRHRARLRAGGQAVPDRGGRLHRRQAPQRRDRRGAGAPAARGRGCVAHTPSTATWGANERQRGRRVRRRARARRLAAGAARAAGRARPGITAVVTVGDDGGSSGRLRAERGGLPPGDLRQALAALADDADPVSAGRPPALLPAPVPPATGPARRAPGRATWCSAG